jgi:DNA (cytosine-5)-methyltransferase 1
VVRENTLKYLSVCSGVEAATVAWDELGFTPVAFSEIEKFPSQVLAHHYPNVPNLGDMTKYKEWNLNEPIDLLVGGTPCQSFSVAGLRKGLEDPRGNLALTYVGILDKFRPKWCVWENVPGVLSSNGGRDFGSFLGALVQLGYGFSYRVLDAQNFGVPQRRRRVFVVGCFGDWASPAKVLFESESLRGDFTKSGKKKKETPRQFVQCFDKQRIDQYGESNIASTIAARDYKDATDLVVIDRAAFNQGENALYQPYIEATETMPTLISKGPYAIGFTIPFKQTADCLTAAYGTKWNGNASADNGSLFVKQNMAIRRLTPIECERLQGFPDDYTNIKEKCPDGTRYKAMGNSMAVPVMRWIGQRIKEAV